MDEWVKGAASLGLGGHWPTRRRSQEVRSGVEGTSVPLGESVSPHNTLALQAARVDCRTLLRPFFECQGDSGASLKAKST